MIDVLIPARNEADTIGMLVIAFRQMNTVGRIIVVDNASNDDTRHVAMDSGACVIQCENIGKGQAIAKGIGEVGTERVLLCDADINPLSAWQMRSLTEYHKRTRNRMVIGAPDFTQNAPWASPGVLWDRLSGIRSLPTEVMTDLRDRGLLYGYTVEVMINLSVRMRKLPVEVIHLRGVKGKVKWGDERLADMLDGYRWMCSKDVVAILGERE